MHVGNDCYIDDKWIPKNIKTGLLDIKGKEIITSNKVTLNGCTSSEAIVGKTKRGFELFFGSKNGSVSWVLDDEIIKECDICVIES